MNSFPYWIGKEYKEEFAGYNFQHILKILRKEIFNHILNYDYSNVDSNNQFVCENNSFELDVFFKFYNVNEGKQKEMIEIISKELKEIKWNTQLAFNETALFIYSTDTLPSSCWSGDL